jgi:uncharacterized protein (DUF58 family)
MELTMGGLIYCAMWLFMGLAAINTQANLLFGVFGLMAGVLLLSWYVGRLTVRNLHVKRIMPPHGVVGVTTAFEYQITNNKRFAPSLSVGLSEMDGVDGLQVPPRTYMLHAAAGMTATAPAEMALRRRGLYQFDRYQLSTGFPFGFIRRSRIGRHPDAFLIFPAIATVEPKLLALCRAADDSGESLRPTPGGNDEFYGIRHYRPGDNPRRIYWRRSARTGVLLTREMTRVAPPRLLIAMDTLLEKRTPEAHARLEQAIAMAASLASATLETGLAVGICAWSNGPVMISPTRGKQQREDLLTLLARLPLNTTYSRSDLLNHCRGALRPNTTTVLITPSNIRLDLLQEARGTMLLLSSSQEDGRQWFHFPPNVDFASCCPADQQPA